jgi:hypothetical protein
MALVDPTASARAIAKRYGLSASAMHRHAENHLPKLLASLADRVGILEANQVMGQAVALYERSLELLAQAENNVHKASHGQDKSRALASATGAIREVRHVLDVLARVNVLARQEGQALDGPDSVVNEYRPDLDAEITERLARRGMPAQNERATESTAPPTTNVAPMLALPWARNDDNDIIDAELVDAQPSPPAGAPPSQ